MDNFVFVAIVVRKAKADASIRGYFASLNTTHLNQLVPHSSITIPLEELKDFTSNGIITTISSVLRNSTSIFSEALEDSPL